MPNTTPIFPLTPYFASCSLASASACTTRQPTATANMTAANTYGVALGGAAGANGRKIDKIQAKGVATAIGGASSNATVIIWFDDATTAWPITELIIPAVTPSATANSVDVSQNFSNLILPSGCKLWASTTVAGAAAAHAIAVYAFGGDY